MYWMKKCNGQQPTTKLYNFLSISVWFVNSQKPGSIFAGSGPRPATDGTWGHCTWMVTQTCHTKLSTYCLKQTTISIQSCFVTRLGFLATLPRTRTLRMVSALKYKRTLSKPSGRYRFPHVAFRLTLVCLQYLVVKDTFVASGRC